MNSSFGDVEALKGVVTDINFRKRLWCADSFAFITVRQESGWPTLRNCGSIKTMAGSSLRNSGTKLLIHPLFQIQQVYYTKS